MSCLCAICSHLVKRNHRKLICNLCKKYVHKCCSDLSAKEFRSNDYTKYWHCSSCNENLTLPFNHFTDEREFQLELYRCFEDMSADTEYMKSHFENMKYNPLDNNDAFEVNDCNSNTQYFSTDNLKETAGIKSSNLSLLCSNVRSLTKNFDALKELLSEIDVNFQIIGLVETWLKEKPHDYYHLRGYNLELCNRNDKRGGGVSMYVDENIAYNVRHDINDLNHLKYTESLFIEIEKSNSQNIVVGVVYRPPDQNIEEFNKYVDAVLCKITGQENKLL